ncbi:MAG: Arc family DNA-binding protein [Hydrogenophaga sp.]|nr:Arc family DNA-binding protein [Hydrogenophaga sp.]
MAQRDEQTNVRLPKDLKEWLVHQASNSRRSLTSEVTFRLEDSRQRQQMRNSSPDAQKGNQQ